MVSAVIVIANRLCVYVEGKSSFEYPLYGER